MGLGDFFALDPDSKRLCSPLDKNAFIPVDKGRSRACVLVIHELELEELFVDSILPPFFGKNGPLPDFFENAPSVPLVKIMAKQIRETPVLRGEEAIRFIKRMHQVEREPMSEAGRKTQARLKKARPYFESFLVKNYRQLDTK